MSRILIFLTFYLCFCILFIFCEELDDHNQWNPGPTNLQEPNNFKAFYVDQKGKGEQCQVEINFERDFGDLTYKYEAYAIFSKDFNYLLPHLSSYEIDQNISLAVNIPDPTGQRGVFIIESNMVLTPIIISICDIGESDQDFPKQFKGVKPTSFKIRAVHFENNNANQSWWESKPFYLTENSLTPQNGGINNLSANWSENSKQVVTVNVKWKPRLSPEMIKSYFILIGLSKDAILVQSYHILNPNATNATINVGQSDLRNHNYVVSVSVLTIEGALTSPFDSPQIPIQPA